MQRVAGHWCDGCGQARLLKWEQLHRKHIFTNSKKANQSFLRIPKENCPVMYAIDVKILAAIGCIHLGYFKFYTKKREEYYVFSRCPEAWMILKEVCLWTRYLEGLLSSVILFHPLSPLILCTNHQWHDECLRVSVDVRSVYAVDHSPDSSKSMVINVYFKLADQLSCLRAILLTPFLQFSILDKIHGTHKPIRRPDNMASFSQPRALQYLTSECCFCYKVLGKNGI